LVSYASEIRCTKNTCPIPSRCNCVSLDVVELVSVMVVGQIPRPKSDPPAVLPDQAGINNASSSIVELFGLASDTDNAFCPLAESVVSRDSKPQAEKIAERTDKLRI